LCQSVLCSNDGSFPNIFYYIPLIFYRTKEPAAEEAATETEEALETADATENENAAEEIAAEIEDASETEDAIQSEPVNATEEEVAEDKKRDAPEDPAEGDESPKQKLKTDVEPIVVGEASAAVEAVQQ